MKHVDSITLHSSHAHELGRPFTVHSRDISRLEQRSGGCWLIDHLPWIHSATPCSIEDECEITDLFHGGPPPGRIAEIIKHWEASPFPKPGSADLACKFPGPVETEWRKRRDRTTGQFFPAGESKSC